MKKAAGLGISFVPVTKDFRQSVRELLVEADQIEAERNSYYHAILQKYALKTDDDSGNETSKNFEKAVNDFNEYKKTKWVPQMKKLIDRGINCLRKDCQTTVTTSDGGFSIELPAGEYLLQTDDVEMLPQRIVWCKVVSASENSRSVVVSGEYAMSGKVEEYVDIRSYLEREIFRDIAKNRPPKVSFHQILHAAATELGIR